MTAFTFTFKIDYDKLNKMMDEFLKQHTNELTSMVGNCLVIGGNDQLVSNLIPQPPENKPDINVDNRPLIGDDIPEDPFSNMFKNSNANTTRSGDRRG